MCFTLFSTLFSTSVTVNNNSPWTRLEFMICPRALITYYVVRIKIVYITLIFRRAQPCFSLSWPKSPNIMIKFHQWLRWHELFLWNIRIIIYSIFRTTHWFNAYWIIWNFIALYPATKHYAGLLNLLVTSSVPIYSLLSWFESNQLCKVNEIAFVQ